MRICIDSCVFINGLTGTDMMAVRLLNLIGPDLTVVIPRLVAQEVTRNLRTTEQVHRFYRLFFQRTSAFIVDDLPRPSWYASMRVRAYPKSRCFYRGFC